MSKLAFKGKSPFPYSLIIWGIKEKINAKKTKYEILPNVRWRLKFLDLINKG